MPQPFHDAQQNFNRLFLAIVSTLFICTAFTSSRLFGQSHLAVQCKPQPEAQASSSGDSPWRLASTDNFCVCCPPGMDPLAIGRRCESLRADLTRKLVGDSCAPTRWTAKCYLVLHPSTDSYLREVGAAGGRTLGSSLTRAEKGRIVSRRIDLRGDVADPLAAALPHELTHVILADEFAAESLPRWADEGLAMQADPLDKLAGHSHDFDRALAEHRALRLAELLANDNYPTGEQRSAFYGESVSLVSFLMGQKKPAEFIHFIHRANEAGYDAALREVYKIRDVGQLERTWLVKAAVASR